MNNDTPIATTTPAATEPAKEREPLPDVTTMTIDQMREESRKLKMRREFRMSSMPPVSTFLLQYREQMNSAVDLRSKAFSGKDLYMAELMALRADHMCIEEDDVRYPQLEAHIKGVDSPQPVEKVEEKDRSRKVSTKELPVLPAKAEVDQYLHWLKGMKTQLASASVPKKDWFSYCNPQLSANSKAQWACEDFTEQVTKDKMPAQLRFDKFCDHLESKLFLDGIDAAIVFKLSDTSIMGPTDEDEIREMLNSRIRMIERLLPVSENEALEASYEGQRKLWLWQHVRGRDREALKDENPAGWKEPFAGIQQYRDEFVETIANLNRRRRKRSAPSPSNEHGPRKRTRGHGRSNNIAKRFGNNNPPREETSSGAGKKGGAGTKRP